VIGQYRIALDSDKRVPASAQRYFALLARVSAVRAGMTGSPALDDLIRVHDVLVGRILTFTAATPEKCSCAITSVLSEVFFETRLICERIRNNLLVLQLSRT
jgi:hypothetical protein